MSNKKEIKKKQQHIKIGTVRYEADFYDKVEFSKWVYRTKRKDFGYMIQHVHGVTWVKRQDGTWGYATKIHPIYRRRFYIPNGLPKSASKAGAIAALIAFTRSEIKEEGSDFKFEDDEPYTLSEILKRLLTYQKRLRTKNKKTETITCTTQ